MAGSRFACDAPTRRAVLVGIGAGAPLLALIASKPGAFDRRLRNSPLQVGDLSGADGRATQLALGKTGETVTVRGFYAPALRKGVSFDLFEGAAGPCLACGLIHDPGASLAVTGGPAQSGLSMLVPQEISGMLAIDARGNVALIA